MRRVDTKTRRLRLNPIVTTEQQQQQQPNNGDDPPTWIMQNSPLILGTPSGAVHGDGDTELEPRTTSAGASDQGSAFDASLTSPNWERASHFPTPHFMLPAGKKGNDNNPLGATSTPKLLYGNERGTSFFTQPATPLAPNVQASNNSTALRPVPTATGEPPCYRRLVEDFEEKLNAVQARFPTVSLVSDISTTACRAPSIASTPTIFGATGKPTFQQSNSNPAFGAQVPETQQLQMFAFNDHTLEQLTSEVNSAPVSRNNSFTFPTTPVVPVADLKSASTSHLSLPPALTHGVHKASAPPAEQSIRRSVEKLSNESRLELLVEIITAIGELKSVAATTIPTATATPAGGPSGHRRVGSKVPASPCSNEAYNSPLFPSQRDAATFFAKAATPKTMSRGKPAPRSGLHNSNNTTCKNNTEQVLERAYSADADDLSVSNVTRDLNRSPGASSHHSAMSSSVASIMDPVPVFESKQLTQTYDREGNEMVNNYSLIGELGSGSFAKVHLAEHNTTQELVAVKVIKKSLRRKFARNAGAATQVATEIALLKKVNHRNIVKLHGVIDDPDDDKVVMIMQYASGGALLVPRRKKSPAPAPEQNSSTDAPHDTEEGGEWSFGYQPISPTLAANYTRQVATGLDYLHRHDILHRDIKPENLLLDGLDQSRVLIGDLGVGAMFSDATALKKTAGTPAFFSPEMCRGEVHLHGKASDIWALGVTTYAMIFGHVPFQEKKGGLSALFDVIQNEPLVIPATTVDGADVVDEHLVDFLRKILNKDPLRRMKLAELKTHPWIVNNRSRTHQQQPTTTAEKTPETTEPATTTTATPVAEDGADFTQNTSGLSLEHTTPFMQQSTTGEMEPEPTDPRKATPPPPPPHAPMLQNRQDSTASSGGDADDVPLTLTVEEIQKAVYRVPSMRLQSRRRSTTAGLGPKQQS